ncbi:chemotaxis protein MotB [Azospirillum thiophilum]|uniref:Chemotaxis protein MotB n=1 Tax=Azospirillum thiophilum TaxID=528244 RepID=A0AAC9EXI8_9PROT|nr:flagellar motor protein MotB [Azospirillum thiophilum]ALG71741.1 chemotaxis protein MotB [Azospirillum thiophilum]KJR66853.1 chemotaxis protein MotB [Azospirillum thiophilum]
MSGNTGGNERPIIIKKKKGGHGGHHGGAWKVAYADFVTAMMAFFLLLWLLNVTTSDQRKGIADYFSPVSVSREQSGSGGMLGGKTITVPGAQISPSSPMSADVPVSGPPGYSSQQTDDADDPTESANGPGQGATGQGQPGGNADTAGANANASADVADQKQNETRAEFQKRMEELAKQLGIPGQKPGEKLSDFAERVKEAMESLQGAAKEARQFQQAATEIRQAIQSVPELEPLAQNLMIDQTPEGLRIQIVDQDRVSMFPGGSGQMYPQTRQLVQQVAKALSKLPNKLSISGHTDSTPFSSGSGRDNWDLSTERANATRRALLSGGVDPLRIQDVVGKADRDPLVADQPNSPRNRRITMVLLRETQAAPATGGQSGGAAAPVTAPAATKAR